MLTQSQKRQLKSLSCKLDIKYQIGKNEINENVINVLNNGLTAHELIKIDVMKSVETPVMELALDLSSKLNAEVVQVVGKCICLYRKNKEKPKIKLVNN